MVLQYYSSLGLTGGFVASFDNGTGILSIVPEPSRALLLMLGLMGVVVRRRRRVGVGWEVIEGTVLETHPPGPRLPAL